MEATPLMVASYQGHNKVVQLLLKFGADPTLQSKSGHTALQYANAKGNDKVIALLKQKKLIIHLMIGKISKCS